MARTSGKSFGGGRKNCTKGISCGDTCIDARERCELELGPLVANSLTKMRDASVEGRLDKVFGLREKLVNRDLSKDEFDNEQGARWLNANIPGFIRAHLNFEGGPGALWTFGIEPAATTGAFSAGHPELIKQMQADGMLPKDFTAAQLQRAINEHPAYLVRAIRQNVEDSKLLNKALNEKRDLLMSPTDDRVLGKLLKGEDVATFDIADTKANTEGYKYMHKAADLAQSVGATSWSNGNMSPLQIAFVDNEWPLAKVYEKALMDPGVFKNRNSWMNYVNSEARTQSIADSIIDKKPERVFVGGEYGKMIMASYIDELTKRGIPFEAREYVHNGVTEAGNSRPSKFLTIQTADSRVLHSNHFTSYMGKEFEDLRKKIMIGEVEGDLVKLKPTPQDEKYKQNLRAREMVKANRNALAEKQRDAILGAALGDKPQPSAPAARRGRKAAEKAPEPPKKELWERDESWLKAKRDEAAAMAKRLGERSAGKYTEEKKKYEQALAIQKQKAKESGAAPAAQKAQSAAPAVTLTPAQIAGFNNVLAGIKKANPNYGPEKLKKELMGMVGKTEESRALVNAFFATQLGQG